MAEKHDVFVGNLAYNTTIDNLKDIFSKVGNVVNVRIVTDRETGRPRGFAFVEYEDAATALSAIRNLDGHDLSGRKLRVSYSNNSSLKDVARQMGQVVQDSYQSEGTSAAKGTAEVVGELKLHEAYDILDAMKRIVDEDSGERAKGILEAHPQLVAALLEIQKRLGMMVAPSLLMSILGGEGEDSAEPADDMEVTASGGADMGTGGAADGVNPHQQHLLQQLMSMSEEDLEKLPPDGKERMLRLKEQLLAQMGR